MEKSSCVLTLLLLFFVQKAPGENCTALFDTCITTLVSGGRNSVLTPPDLDKNLCNDDSVEKMCTSYKNFSLCVNKKMAKCLKDEEISAQIAVFQQTYKFYCANDLLCGRRIINCLCEADLVSDFTNVTNMCNNQKNFRQCIRKIKDCDNGVPMQQATLFITTTDAICKTACTESYKCPLGKEGQSRSAFGSSETVTESTCRILMQAVGCVDKLADICNVTMDQNVTSMKTRDGNGCRGTDASNGNRIPTTDIHSSNGSGIPASGLERLFSVTFVSLVMAALTLVKV